MKPENVQLKASTNTELHKYFKDIRFSDEEKKKLFTFLKKGRMHSVQFKKQLCCINPEAEKLFSGFGNDVYKLELTPVGVAIALANFKRKVGYMLSWPYRMKDA